MCTQHIVLYTCSHMEYGQKFECRNPIIPSPAMRNMYNIPPNYLSNSAQLQEYLIYLNTVAQTHRPSCLEYHRLLSNLFCAKCAAKHVAF